MIIQFIVSIFFVINLLTDLFGVVGEGVARGVAVSVSEGVGGEPVLLDVGRRHARRVGLDQIEFDLAAGLGRHDRQGAL